MRRHDGWWDQVKQLHPLQVEAIQRNRPLVIVGTPGRLAELSRNGVLLSHSCAILVFDEVNTWSRIALSHMALKLNHCVLVCEWPSTV